MKVEILLTILSTLLAIIVTALQLQGILGPSLAAIIIGFLILVILHVYTIIEVRKIDRINSFLEVIKSIIDNLIVSFKDVNSLIFSKKPQNQVTWNDIQSLYNKIFTQLITSMGLKAFDTLFKSVKSTPEEKRKKELMQKARNGNITYDEAEELKRLLEKQKKEKEAKGDLVGAILLGLALIFVLWLLSELTRSSKK